MVTLLQATGTATEAVSNTIPIHWTDVVEAAIVAVLAYLIARVLSGLLTRVADRFFAHRFRITLLVPLVKFLVYGTATYTILTLLFELTTAQLVAFSGVLGVAIGFGLKDLFADVVGGLVLVAERPYQIGDMVTMGDHYGEVIDIGIRSTTLYTLDDTVVTVPNYTFFDEAVANANDGNAEMLVTVTFQVDPESDVSRAREIVEEAVVSSQYVYVDDDAPVEVFVYDEVYYRTVEGRAYVNDLRNQLKFESDLTERVLRAFEAEGIESPAVPAGVGEPGE